MNDRDAFNALLRMDFASFVRKVFSELNPGEQLIWAPYLDASIWQLELCRTGKVKRLIICLPPRHLKSIIVSVALPAYLLGLDPQLRILTVSHSNDLADKFARETRAIMQMQFHRQAFPGTVLSREKNKEHDFMTTKRGGRFATAIGGQATGRGADIITIDDPLKPPDAMSEAIRTSTNAYMNNTLYTRLDDKMTGEIIIVQQRTHMDDPVGHALEKDDGWQVL